MLDPYQLLERYNSFIRSVPEVEEDSLLLWYDRIS
jgi:hypothetical protein